MFSGKFRLTQVSFPFPYAQMIAFALMANSIIMPATFSDAAVDEILFVASSLPQRVAGYLKFETLRPNPVSSHFGGSSRL